jgi:hypothetical protein
MRNVVLTLAAAAALAGALALGAAGCGDRGDAPAGPAATAVSGAQPGAGAPAADPAAPGPLAAPPAPAGLAEKQAVAEAEAREGLKRPLPPTKVAEGKTLPGEPGQKVKPVGRPVPGGEPAAADDPLRTVTPVELAVVEPPKADYPPFEGRKLALVHTENVVGELEPCG